MEPVKNPNTLDSSEASAAQGPMIVYDGECPFCAAYVRMARLSDAAGTVTMVDARGDHPVTAEAWAAGLDLHQGMVVKLDGQMHHGAQGLVVLNALTTRSGIFNRIMRVAFASPARARLLYPPLVLGRRIVLWLLRKKPLVAPPV